MSVNRSSRVPSADEAATGEPRQRGGLFARETAEYDRGIGFFDAIYGFAVTLLIANLDAPPAEAWRNIPTLLETGILHQLGGFALSFIVIAAFWRANVSLVRLLTGMDAAVTTTNLVAAALVILIPFTTQGISDPGSSAYALPTVLYALNIALASLAQLAMFEVGRARGLEAVPMSTRQNIAFLLDQLAIPVVFLASIPIALVWGTQAGQITWATLLVIGPLSAYIIHRSAATKRHPLDEASAR